MHSYPPLFPPSFHYGERSHCKWHAAFSTRLSWRAKHSRYQLLLLLIYILYCTLQKQEAAELALQFFSRSKFPFPHPKPFQGGEHLLTKIVCVRARGLLLLFPRASSSFLITSNCREQRTLKARRMSRTVKSSFCLIVKSSETAHTQTCDCSAQCLLTF